MKFLDQDLVQPIHLENPSHSISMCSNLHEQLMSTNAKILESPLSEINSTSQELGSN